MKIWYAAQKDTDDDWDTGSYNFKEALSIAKKYFKSGHKNALVASIQNGVCVEEYFISVNGKYDKEN